MPVNQSNTPTGRAPESVWAWILDDGTGCVIACGADYSVELRVVSGDTVIRRAQYSNVRRALEMARHWRVECEVEQQTAEFRKTHAVEA